MLTIIVSFLQGCQHCLYLHRAMNVTGILIAIGMVQGCQHQASSEVKALSVIHFYYKEGENKAGCSFALQRGMHRFANNSCTNDEYYYFKLTNPTEGLSFGIYNAGHCNSDEAYSRYYVRGPAHDSSGNPLPMPRTGVMRVDAARYASDEPLATGLHANGWRGQQLQGKVSCVSVEAEN